MHHDRHTFEIKLPFVNSKKSLIFDLTKILLSKRFNSCILFDREGYALSDNFDRIDIELLVFKLCPALFG